jgi:hypothetical protein
MRLKRVSGVSCNVIASSALIFDSDLHLIGGGGFSFSGSSFGDYCEMTTLADIPLGTKIAAIYLVAGNVGAVDIVLDGSPSNSGVSINGSNDAQTDGGFAFELCDNQECDGNPTFSLPTPVNPPPPLKNPILIIPGVEGTEIFKDTEKLWLDIGRNFTDLGDQFMDPMQFNNNITPIEPGLTVGEVISKKIIDLLVKEVVVLDYTEGLIKEFNDQGYIEGSDLFLFPYDWRYGVSANVIESLKQKINEIKTQTGSQEVDVVAHSTGGLLLKKYVMENPSSNSIGKAVFVGVPSTGAPKAIKVLLQGDNFGIPWIADEEIKKIAKNLPVIYDLSPSETYFNQKGSYVQIRDESILGEVTKNDLDFDQTNDFLANDHQLNSQAISNSSNLHDSSFDNYDLRTAGVDLYSIVGCKAGTIGKIIERRVQTLLGGTKIGYELEEVPGDGTVPLESATNLPIDSDHKYYALNAKHGTMMTANNSRQTIVNIITGSNLPVDEISQDISDCNLNGKAISIFSPLNIDIKDQDGNHAGILEDGSTENNIPNADFEVMGEHKFVYLPTDEGQTYEISLEGTGDGTFTLKNSDIIEGTVENTETFADIPVTAALEGSLNLEDSKLSLDSSGDGDIDLELQGLPGQIVTIPKPLTVTADNKTIILGETIPSLTATVAGFIDGTVNDVAGLANCTTTATNSSPVGVYPITCTVGTLTSSNYSFDTFVPGTLKIVYRFDGFLQPINDTAHQIGQALSVFKAGSTVPVKFQLKKVDGTIIQSGSVPTWLTPQKGSSMSAAVDESVYSVVGSSGSAFKWDTNSQQYIYNWSTKGLPAGFWYKIFAKLDGGSIYSVTIGLK